MRKEILLEGKTAVITGGATGIGFAIASEMRDAGARVVIIGRREEKLKKAACELGDDCIWYQADITQIRELRGLVEKIEQKVSIDILVNNAGINIKKIFLNFSQMNLIRFQIRN